MLFRRLGLMALLVCCLLGPAAASAQGGVTGDAAAVVYSAPTEPFVQILLGFLAVVLPALGSFIAWQLKRRTDIQGNSAAAQAVDAAADDGAGLAYRLLAQLAAAKIPATVEIHNAMIAAGVQHVLAAAGDSAKVREETGASLGQTVAAKLGTLMAADPNVTIVPVPAGPAVLLGGAGPPEPAAPAVPPIPDPPPAIPAAPQPAPGAA